MVTVKDILEDKGHEVATASPDDTILDVAKQMNAQRIGAVVVVEADKVVGILSERDILREIVAACKSPEALRVADIMTKAVACCKPDSSLQECQSAMTSKRLRHLPVVEDGKLVGIISSGDILAREVEVQQTTIEYLDEYLHGRR